MAKIDVRVEHYEKIELYGLWAKANDKTVAKDIPHLAAQYHKKTNTQDGDVLPFFILSKNYDTQTRDFELFIGSPVVNETLEYLALPQAQYGKITVKPKFGFAWGLAIGKAKRYFYTKWLPSSEYQAVNLEYEYHTEKTTGKNPTVDVIFAITVQAK